MKCPNCGYEHPDEFKECPECMIIFSEWQDNEEPTNDPILPPSKSQKKTSTSSRLAFFVLVGFLIWFMMLPEGLNIPDGAYKNDEYKFAISAPSKWIMFNKDNYETVIAKYKARIPEPLKNLIAREIIIGFVKIPKGKESTPLINVIIIKSNLPPINENEKEKAVRTISSVLSRNLPDYKLLGSRIIGIDKLKSLEILGQLKTLKFSQTFVPGRNRSYMITCSADAYRYHDLEKTFSEVVESFRVMDRQPNLWYIAMRTFQAGLFGALIYLVFSLFKLFKKA